MSEVAGLREKIKSVDRSKPYVFVSYSKKDAEKVYSIVVSLQEKGVNLWIDKELEATAGIAWNKKAFEAMRNKNCIKLLFFMSTNSFMSIPVCAELEYTHHKAVLASHDQKSIMIVPVSITEHLNLRHVLEECKKLPEINQPIEEKGYEIFKAGAPKIEEEETVFPDSDMETLLNIIKMDCFENSTEITVVSGGDIDSIMTNIKPAINQEVNDVEAVSKPAETQHDVEDKSAGESVEKSAEKSADRSECEDTDEDADGGEDEGEGSRSFKQLVFYILGERMEGNQSDFMILAIGRLLKAHPEAIKSAIAQFNCLSDVDYENEHAEGMPSYFRVCHTVRIGGQQVCIGTSYGLKEKLRLVARIMHLVGEDPASVRVEGLELPQIKERSAEAGSAQGSGRSANEEYVVFGKKCNGNQTQMMWDVFAELADRYPEKIPGLTILTSVKETGKVTNAQTKDANPSYFRIAKEFQVNGISYYVGTAYGRNDKLTQIRKMVELCGAPKDAFVISGESEPVSTNTVAKKKVYNI
ncbi:MAG: toll/interleukin-1 receptor domain-containing protein [Lachnospiraceae bacterium]|nr:toll/interleukin-1 receptor domain-containing protein [Lachnospiraceae bacterium]